MSMQVPGQKYSPPYSVKANVFSSFDSFSSEKGSFLKSWNFLLSFQNDIDVFR